MYVHRFYHWWVSDIATFMPFKSSLVFFGLPLLHLPPPVTQSATLAGRLCSVPAHFNTNISSISQRETWLHAPRRHR